jgi:hypothetical protein
MPGADPVPAPARTAWYRQPILWLGAVLFVASLAGCVWMIVLGMHHADTPLETSSTVFGVPVSAHSSPHPPPAGSTP